MNKKTSIFNEPDGVIDKSVWDTSEKIPKLKPSLKQAIVDRFLDNLINFGGYNQPENFVEGFWYVGDSSHEWAPSAKPDILVLVDWNELVRLNPDKKSHELRVWRQLYDTFRFTLNTQKISGMKFPLIYYVLPPKKENRTLQSFKSLFNFQTNEWDITLDKDFDGKSMFTVHREIQAEADEYLTKLELQIDHLKDNIQEYYDVKVFLSENDVSEYDLKLYLEDQLAEIEENILRLKLDYDEITRRRDKGLNEETPFVKGKPRTWTPGNLLFKLIERQTYVGLLEALNTILGERHQQLSERDLPKVINLLKTSSKLDWKSLVFKTNKEEVLKAVKDDKWQDVRKSMKGKSLDEKYKTLKNWLKTNHNSQESKCQVSNYVGALARGGLIPAYRKSSLNLKENNMKKADTVVPVGPSNLDSVEDNLVGGNEAHTDRKLKRTNPVRQEDVRHDFLNVKTIMTNRLSLKRTAGYLDSMPDTYFQRALPILQQMSIDPENPFQEDAQRIITGFQEQPDQQTKIALIRELIEVMRQSGNSKYASIDDDYNLNNFEVELDKLIPRLLAQENGDTQIVSKHVLDGVVGDILANREFFTQKNYTADDVLERLVPILRRLGGKHTLEFDMIQLNFDVRHLLPSREGTQGNDQFQNMQLPGERHPVHHDPITRSEYDGPLEDEPTWALLNQFTPDEIWQIVRDPNHPFYPTAADAISKGLIAKTLLSLRKESNRDSVDILIDMVYSVRSGGINKLAGGSGGASDDQPDFNNGNRNYNPYENFGENSILKELNEKPLRAGDSGNANDAPWSAEPITKDTRPSVTTIPPLSRKPEPQTDRLNPQFNISPYDRTIHTVKNKLKVMASTYIKRSINGANRSGHSGISQM